MCGARCRSPRCGVEAMPSLRSFLVSMSTSMCLRRFLQMLIGPLYAHVSHTGSLRWRHKRGGGPCTASASGPGCKGGRPSARHPHAGVAAAAPRLCVHSAQAARVGCALPSATHTHTEGLRSRPRQASREWNEPYEAYGAEPPMPSKFTRAGGGWQWRPKRCASRLPPPRPPPRWRPPSQHACICPMAA